MTNKADRLEKLMAEMLGIYKAKNKDYGDSFSESFEEFGLIAPVVRMNDKMNRIKSLSKGEDRQVKDESLIDSLMDLANYALMTVIELENEDEEDDYCELDDYEGECDDNFYYTDEELRIDYLEDGEKYNLRAVLSGINEDQNYLNLNKGDAGYVLADSQNCPWCQAEFTKDEVRNLIQNWDVDLDDFEIIEVESDYEAGRQENL